MSPRTIHRTRQRLAHSSACRFFRLKPEATGCFHRMAFVASGFSRKARISPVRKATWLLVGVCAVTFFAGLGTTALWEPDEPRFAEATRQMLLRHDYVTPWFNDRPRFEKPILLYWLQLPFFAVLGDSETAARMPAALAGLIAVLATFGIGRELISVRAGVHAGVALATTLRFVLYFRQGLTDVPVA